MFSVIAWGRVRSDGLLLNGRNATVDRVMAGVYDVDIGSGLSAEGGEMMVTLVSEQQGSPAIPDVTNLSGTVKRMVFYDQAGAMVDTGFYFKIEKLDIL